MRVTDRCVDDKGVVHEHTFDLPDVLTLEQAQEEMRLQAIREANAAIQAQMDTADLKAIRALTEGDTARIAAHKASQAALRAKLKPLA